MRQYCTDTTIPQFIWCPICRWVPCDDSRWACSCAHRWHTFLTAAKCPKCTKQWHDTACPFCHQRSAHKTWYHITPAPTAALLPERNVDWTVFAGNEWYSPNDVVPAFEAIRNNHSDCQNQFLSAIGNNHSGTLYEAATAAVPILIKIASTHTRSSVAATSLDILEQIFYFDSLEDVPTVRIGEHAYTTAGAVKHFMISESEALLSVKAGAELHKMLEDAFAHYKSNDANAGKHAN